MDDKKRQDLRIIVRGAYDMQKLRIQKGNRICANFKSKLGQEPSQSEDELTADAKALLADLRQSHKRITDAILNKRIGPKNFEGDELISSFTEFVLVTQYIDMEESERAHFKSLEKILEEFPIYTQFLKGVKGCGPAMSGVIISEFDIHRAKYVSSLYAYAGLDCGPDGAGRSRRADHLIEKEYTNKAGELTTRKSITFNPFLKTKLMGVLASSFLRAGDNTYSRVYREYKTRLENHVEHSQKTKGHRHNMALRYMIKAFLRDLYFAWCPLEGLQPHPIYAEAYLGHVHQDKGGARARNTIAETNNRS